MSDRGTPAVGKSRLRKLGRARRLVVVGVVGGVSALSLNAIGPATASVTPTTLASTHRAASHDVIANLWEWNWTSIAKECVSVLGPKGYGGVQVAPPQNSVTLNGSLGTPVHPWWEVYQPVDYTLTSRMGNEAQFKSMVTTCRKAGVKVYVDAVINHMARDGRDSYSGAHFDRYNYLGLYTRRNFHSYPADCPVPPPTADPTTAAGQNTILNFNDYRQVTKCELLALPDLRSETSYVRHTIAGYLNKLIGYGVSGFRVDAAKHIGQADLSAIKRLLHRTVDGETPYLALEVFPGPGALSMFAFKDQGSLLGFDFAYAVHDLFKSYDAAHVGNITGLRIFGERAGLLPGDKTLVFVENHDTERGDTTLSYRDGATNTLANEFMLAYGYGRPQVYASYAFQGLNPDSPPSNARGIIKNTDCNNGWVCVDRYTGVANMVGWHNFVGTAKLGNWYDDQVNLIAFSRGNKGWIAINNHATAQTHTFQTGLHAGRYCDIIHGRSNNRTCTGQTVTVNAHGRATVNVPGKDSVAIDAADLIRS
jgi:alpha-amylase